VRAGARRRLTGRIFYYPGARFDASLVAQALIMIVVQTVLLKVALDNRAPSSAKGGEAAVPFAAGEGSRRPYRFWQWRASRP
jgi:hypothetical protein